MFIGREPDVGINEACMWYKLPDMTTAIDTVAGLWVTPVGTTTYVVRQQLWCSGVKWDTVVVHESAVGFAEARATAQEASMYPVPANDALQLEFGADVSNAFLLRYIILNSLGQVMREEELTIDNNRARVSLKHLPDGFYLIELNRKNFETLTKRIVVQH